MFLPFLRGRANRSKSSRGRGASPLGQHETRGSREAGGFMRVLVPQYSVTLRAKPSVSDGKREAGAGCGAAWVSEGGEVRLKSVSPMEHGLSAVTCPSLLLKALLLQMAPLATQLPKLKPWVPSSPRPVDSSSAMLVEPTLASPTRPHQSWTARLPQTHRGPLVGW